MASDINLGIMAYFSPTGLGYQTLSYCKYLKPSKVMLADISKLNGMPVYEDWHSFDIRTNGIPTNEEVDRFLDGLDVVLVAETPLNYYLFEEANRRGIKSILIPNIEFADYFQQPNLPKPTVFALPTLWMVDKFDPKIFPNVMHLPLPVDTKVFKPRSVFSQDIFFHIAGRPAHMDRNGTLDFIAAVKLIQDKVNAKFVLYAQDLTPEIKTALNGVDIELRTAETPEDLYSYGTVLILPRRYGGLCLPAAEAVATGTPVIMPDIDPNNRWLPKDWLVPAKLKTTFQARLPIDVYQTDIEALAEKIVYLINNPTQVIRMHLKAKEMAEFMGWDKNLIRYQEVLSHLHDTAMPSQ